MNIEFKDEIIDTRGQLDNAPRYLIRDNNGNVIFDNVQLEMKTPVVQQPTPVNKELLNNLFNDISPVGSIRLYSDVKNRPKSLLCDGSNIFATDYPLLRDKLTGYDFYEYLDVSTTGLASTNKIYYLNGYFIIVYSTTLAYSTDGFTWNTITIPEYFNDITYDNGKYFAVGYDRCPVYYSEDLINWTLKTKIFTSSNPEGRKILYKNGVIVVSGYYGFIYYSTDDGDTFNEGVGTSSSNYTCQMLYHLGDKFICYINNGGSGGYYYNIYSSPDGITWTLDFKSTTESYPLARSVPYNGYLYYVTSNILYRTNDGYNIEQVGDFTEFTNGFTYAYLLFNEDDIYLLPSSSSSDNIPIMCGRNNFTEWITITTEGQSSLANTVTDGEKFININGTKPLRIYYLNGREKKLILPTYIDKTNQIYGYINSEE